MGELELVKLHEDGEHLVLAGADGTQFVLPITESLRAAVRRDRPQLEHLRAQDASSLPPREIQARLRAGQSVDEVAETAGIPTEQVRRYAGPVEAEQEYVIRRAQSTVVGHDADSPTLGDLASARLTARDVDPESVEWTAARETGKPWVLTAAFRIGEKTRTARWTYDPSSRALHDLDDEARWLSQGETADAPLPRGIGAPVFDVDAAPRRALAAVPPPAAEPDDAPPPPAEPADDETATLLDALSQRRGVRAPSTESTDDLDDETGDHDPPGPEHRPDEFGPQSTFDLEGLDPPALASHPSRGATVLTLARPRVELAATDGTTSTDDVSRADDAPRPHGTEATDGPGAEHPSPGDDPSASALATPPPTSPQAPPQPSPGSHGHEPDAPNREARRAARKGRAKVPSWDEIVFGARPEH
ncbi:septation protein SepH [Oerskovia flava]|uniref:septation protein SepH n=1 Tax=Oerskovia flava TaxID=2986422 RepID=UPI00223F2DA1|nr:septation protein SepH [Oerskovia sp. JB1-3-2]